MKISKDLVSKIETAVATGWCSKENEHKEMDVVLASAIVRNVLAVIDSHEQENGGDEVTIMDRTADGKVRYCETGLEDHHTCHHDTHNDATPFSKEKG